MCDQSKSDQTDSSVEDYRPVSDSEYEDEEEAVQEPARRRTATQQHLMIMEGVMSCRTYHYPIRWHFLKDSKHSF
jgi:hypothetical protein